MLENVRMKKEMGITKKKKHNEKKKLPTKHTVTCTGMLDKNETGIVK